MAASCAPVLSKMSFSRPGVLPIFLGDVPPPRGCSSNFNAGNGCRDGSAGCGLAASGGDWVSCPLSLGLSWLFPNDVVQRDYKNDKGDGNQEPPVVFAREVNTRAVEFDNGDGSIVDTDRCNGKKCRNGDDRGQKKRLSLLGHEPISMDLGIGEVARIHVDQWSTWKESVPPTNLLVRCGHFSGSISGFHPLCPNTLMAVCDGDGGCHYSRRAGAKWWGGGAGYVCCLLLILSIVIASLHSAISDRLMTTAPCLMQLPCSRLLYGHWAAL